MREKKIKISFTDFECNLLINGINEWRNIQVFLFNSQRKL